MPRKDFTQVAFDVVQQATGQIVKPPKSVKAQSGRKGGLKGGKTRMESLTEQERIELAKKAAAARWPHKPPPDTLSGGKKRRV